MNILIIGRGGREHALAKKCAQSPLVSQVFVAPGNAGICECAVCVDIEESDGAALLAFAKQVNIALTIPGSEAALEAGVVDLFEAHGQKIFGPTKQAAMIETSKTFAKDLMAQLDISSAPYQSFTSYEAAFAYLLDQTFPVVIKEDGLKAGKGVYIVHTMKEGNQVLKKCFAKPNRVVMEGFLEGEEFSLICMVHQGQILPMRSVQDHKRAYDGDQGPNTGGMGVYSPVPQISEAMIQQSIDAIITPITQALENQGTGFSGFLYAGLMVCEHGICVIEFNARMGDPEAQVLMPALESDVVEVILALFDHQNPVLRWNQQSYVGVVLASTNYPESATHDVPIYFHDVDANVYHMGTKQGERGYLTGGGRVLTIVGEANHLEQAIEHAYQNVAKITSDALFYRKDIGKKGLNLQ